MHLFSFKTALICRFVISFNFIYFYFFIEKYSNYLSNYDIINEMNNRDGWRYLHMFNWTILLMPTRQHKFSGEIDANSLISDNDYRTEFQKDFDTICNSSSLRRLQSKAQVFPLEREDFSRTRLTHSIEVMAIAESMGCSLIKMLEGKVTEQSALASIKNIPTILKSAALIHDIGNPPFGHISEGVISKWFNDNLSKLYFKNNQLVFDDRFHDVNDDLEHILSSEQKEDFINFDGNAQALRIITHLQNPIKYTGMNLTYPIMATIIKYPCNPETKKNSLGKNPTKKDYFLEEKEIYLDIQKELQLNHSRHPLTFILEACDDIAYLTADLEDACRKKLILIEDIVAELNSQIESTKSADKNLINYAIYCLNKYINSLSKSKHGKALDDHDKQIIIRQFRAQIKGKLISESIKAFKNNYQSIMEGNYNGELLKEANTILLRNVFANLLDRKVYYSRDIVKIKIESCKIITTLLPNYILSVFNYHKKSNAKFDDVNSLIYNTISQDYRNVCNKSINKYENAIQKDIVLNLEEKNQRKKRQICYYNLLLVLDQISGMTDTYAFDAYHIINAI